MESFQNKGSHFKIVSDESRSGFEIFSNDSRVTSTYFESTLELLVYGSCLKRLHRERFHHHRLQRKPLISDPGMHHGTCVTHVPWCMPGPLLAVAGKTFPAFPAHAQPVNLRIWQEDHWTLWNTRQWISKKLSPIKLCILQDVSHFVHALKC